MSAETMDGKSGADAISIVGCVIIKNALIMRAER